MEWIETTGRTLEEAQARAADLLGVDEAEAEFVVVSEPRLGLFGRLKTQARVRARIRPVRPRPKLDRRDRRRRGERGERPDRAAKADRPARDEPDEVAVDEPVVGGSAPTGPKKKARRGAKGGRSTSTSQVAAVEGDAGIDSEPIDHDLPTSGAAVAPEDPVASDGEPTSTRSTEPRARRSATTQPQPPVALDSANDDLDDDNEENYDMDPESMQAEASRAAEFLEGLATAFGIAGSTVTSTVSDDVIDVAVDGEDLGLLIGQRGQTLQAVQDLTRAVAQRNGRASARLHVDVAGYRQKRSAALSRFAVQIANDVVATGQGRALEPMTAPDRKVVHDAVQTVAGVESISEGEDPNRYILIRPV